MLFPRGLPTISRWEDRRKRYILLGIRLLVRCGVISRHGSIIRETNLIVKVSKLFIGVNIAFLQPESSELLR
jgi:hypothetical protein